ncbi:MAG: tetratricopeptide repeat protein [Spirochaetaceae bacterium]|nr:tetratricopeptide repeat protein [Spirochaetaceae bacterium]
MKLDKDSQTQLAKDLFNKVWDLLEKDNRTVDEDFEMIHAAHASCYHWGEVGTSLEVERGEWQISRVYSVLGRSYDAIFHAKRCYEICNEDNIKDFDIAFAYEALSRAYGAAGDIEKREEYYQLAVEVGHKIDKKEDRVYFFSDLSTIK